MCLDREGGKFPDEGNSYLKTSDTGGYKHIGEGHGFGQIFHQNIHSTRECLPVHLWIAAYLLGKPGSDLQVKTRSPLISKHR